MSATASMGKNALSCDLCGKSATQTNYKQALAGFVSIAFIGYYATKSPSLCKHCRATMDRAFNAAANAAIAVYRKEKVSKKK